MHGQTPCTLKVALHYRYPVFGQVIAVTLVFVKQVFEPLPVKVGVNVSDIAWAIASARASCLLSPASGVEAPIREKLIDC